MFWYLFLIPNTDFDTQIWVAADIKYWSNTSLKRNNSFKTWGLVIIYLNKKILVEHYETVVQQQL